MWIELPTSSYAMMMLQFVCGMATIFGELIKIVFTMAMIHKTSYMEDCLDMYKLDKD